MVGVSQAIVLGVPAVVVLALAVWVYRSASKLRAGSMTPAQRLMLRQLNEDTTLTFPAFYLGPQPVGTDKVSLIVTRHTVSVRAGAGVGTVLCDADGARGSRGARRRPGRGARGGCWTTRRRSV